MIRVVLVHLLLFLLPFVLYAAWIHLARQSKQEDSIWKDAPLFGLVSAGLALMAAGLVAFAVFTGSEPEGVYHPAEIRDGKLVPSRIE